MKNIDGKARFKLQQIKLPLKKTYYILFISFIVVPLLIVLLTALIILNQRFREQAIRNIESTQESIATEMLSDVKTISLRLAHLIHTNNNEILDYASYADTEDATHSYVYSQKLQQSGNLVFEPASNFVSISFYMKDGSYTYIDNGIVIPEVENTGWYQQALLDKNQVYVGSYQIVNKHDAYKGSKDNSLLLAFSLAPDWTTDRNEKIEMVVIYYATDVADKIVTYNRGYLGGENNLGMMQIVDEKGLLVFSVDGELIEEEKGYTCIRTPVEVNNAIWYVESYIETRDLTGDFLQIAGILLVIAICIFAFAGYFSRFLLKSIVAPMEEMSAGLKQVEEGNLDVHIAAQGQTEIRNMIHQFNAMVRRLRVLISEYEEQVRNAKTRPEDYLAAMIRKEMTPWQVAEKSDEFFTDAYVILELYMDAKAQVENNLEMMKEIFNCCERNPRFASRCVAYIDGSNTITAVYRVTEVEYNNAVSRMIQEIQQEVYKKLDVQLCVCVSKQAQGPDEFEDGVESAKQYLCFRHLYGENAVIDLNKNAELIARIEQEVDVYGAFAEALYIADEKNVSGEKEKIFATFVNRGMEEIRITVLAAVLAIGNVFSRNNSSFTEVFGQQSNYIEKFDRISDVRSMKLWLTNYCAWILDYSAAKLRIAETDVIIRAKRYIAEHCEEPELSLTAVADYVELNEKYFTNRFTKETGETFSSYLTALRMQKARELLKTTTFKIYEISEMSGYRNVEHFNRVFKKENNMTPAQYRKTM